MTQPEALRLADLLEMGSIWQDQERAATELRRLHAELERCKTVCAATAEGWRVDAERYRYLRNRNPQEILPVIGPAAGVWIDCDDENGELTLLTGEDADKAIDEERSKT